MNKLLYVYWRDGRIDANVIDNAYMPIIYSIASFRKWDTETEIVVLDTSEYPQQWGEYPELLNFTVLHKQWAMHDIWESCKDQPYIKSYRHTPKCLSKIVEIYQYILDNSRIGDNVIVADCDIVFVKPFFPFASDSRKICCGINGGLWYFTNTDENIKTLRDWAELCVQVCTSNTLASLVTNSVYRSAPELIGVLHEETTIRFLRLIAQDQFADPHIGEDYIYYWLYKRDDDFNTIKAIHITSWSIAKKIRISAYVYISELREQLISVLGDKCCSRLHSAKPIASLTDKSSLIMLENFLLNNDISWLVRD